MFFQVLRRTTIKMIAATIQVQIIEFVMGKPNTLKTAGAAEGTTSCAGSAGTMATGFAAAEIVPCGGELSAGWAGAAGANNASSSAQTKKIFPKCFT